MPSITAYTPYETLAFCQSVARHGAPNAAAFEHIAATLNSNDLIREGQTYDHARLTADALRALYTDLLEREKDQSKRTVNGDNPRKRKLSASPAPPDDAPQSDQLLVQHLIDRLYARFREQVIKDIRHEEDAFVLLEAEVQNLEKQEEEVQRRQKEHSSQPPQSQTQDQPAAKQLVKEPGISSPDPAAAQLHASLDIVPGEQTTLEPTAHPPAATDAIASPASRSTQPPTASSRSPAPSTPMAVSMLPSTEPAVTKVSQPPVPNQVPSAFHPSHPSQSPQRQGYSTSSQQVQFQHGAQAHPLPGMPTLPQMPPPSEVPPQKRTGSSSGPARTSPMPAQQYPYPAYPPPQGWQHAASPYAQPPTPYNNFYMQSPNGRPPIQYQTPPPLSAPAPVPHNQAYPPPYPQSAPGYYPGPPPNHGWRAQQTVPYYPYPVSAGTTPITRPEFRRSLQPTSSTPWKKRKFSQNIPRPPSPTRPEREVSPLSDTEPATRPEGEQRRLSPTSEQGKFEEQLSVPEVQPPRGRQAARNTPSAYVASRSQSIASRTSETPTGKRKRIQPQTIKAEPPSTPAPVASDSEQAQSSTTRRSRTRTGNSTKETPRALVTNKRKRSTERESATPSLPTPVRVQTVRQFSDDTSLVSVSRNFVKTANLLLNDITSHKLAGIFAKPLSERDAPGYKDLVLQPQDLKSIKTAVTKGGRAALTAIDALEEIGSDDQPTTPADPATVAQERSLGNGSYLVKKTEDLAPPKGIVNSAQLEMELVRMFANAVMFNPLPSSERGFGRSLRLLRHGREVSEGDEESSNGSPGEEGIIADAREMFEDVQARVTKWRELESERTGADDTSKAQGGPRSISVSQSVRHSSVSVSEMEGVDEGTPEATTERARRGKRRRIEKDG